MKPYREYWLSESCAVKSPVNNEKSNPVPNVSVTSGMACMAASRSEIGVSLTSTLVDRQEKVTETARTSSKPHNATQEGGPVQGTPC